MLPTAKAESLPDDLKTYWQDAMAEKFPMTQNEALAYIQNKYGDKSAAFAVGNQINVNVYKEIFVPEGASPPSFFMSFRYYTNRYGKIYLLYDVVVLHEFKKSIIDKLFEEKKDV